MSLHVGRMLPLAAVVSVVSACATHGPDAQGRWELCDIVREPEAAIGKTVTFRAQVHSDGLERAVLVDDACPKQGIVPSTFHAGEGSDVTRAIDTEHPGTSGKRISATWTGVIELNGRMIRLRMTDIRDVQIK